jgi:CheY-like chemotaxis protein
VCHFVNNHPDLRRTPVLLISGTVNPSVLEEAARVQSDDVLGKPFHMNELVRKVADLLRHTGDASIALTAPPDPERTEQALSVRETLDRLAALSGVEWAALSDRDGLLIESTGGPGTEAALAAALSAWLAPGLAGIGRELRRGALHGVSMEYAEGILTAHAVGGPGSGGGMLLVFLRDPGAMAEVRYWVRKSVPELAHAAELSC